MELKKSNRYSYVSSAHRLVILWWERFAAVFFEKLHSRVVGSERSLCPPQRGGSLPVVRPFVDIDTFLQEVLENFGLATSCSFVNWFPTIHISFVDHSWVPFDLFFQCIQVAVGCHGMCVGGSPVVRFQGERAAIDTL